MKTLVRKYGLIHIVLSVMIVPHFSFCQSLSHKETLEKMMEIAGIKPGMVIGEIGAGGGDLTFPMAERIGPDGTVYANDISQASLDYIDEKGIRNIVTVLGESDDPVFPVKNLDVIIMKNVFHDLENPLSLLENLKKYLKPGASFIVIEAHRSTKDKKTAMSFHDMTEDQLLSMIEKSSFNLMQPVAFLPSRWSIYKLRVDPDKEKNVWSNWLTEFQSIIDRANDLEKDMKISSVKKRIAWERILNSFRDNIPETEEDELLKEYISKKIELLWENKKPIDHLRNDKHDNKKSKEFPFLHLRSDYKKIDGNEYSEILERLGFKAEFRVRSGDFPNQFELKSINGDSVVIDIASGLMWHQSGSEETMDFFAAQEWIDDLNIWKYAGHSDWRLPTTEELLSLIETSNMGADIHINPLFSYVQSVIWTGDDYYPGRSWVVNFSKFTATFWDILKINPSWVRPVRSLQ